MKLPCELVQDVLPLYHDGVCSSVSKDLVDEHLKDCEKCKSFLKGIDVEMAPIPDEGKPLEAIQKTWRKSKMKALIKGLAIAVAVTVLLFGVFLFATQVSFITAPAEDMQVSDVCQLSDGRLAYCLELEGGMYYNNWEHTLYEDGSYYITIKRPLINLPALCWPDLCQWNPNQLVDVAENNVYQQTYGDSIVITSVYVGEPGDAVLVWEEGMELPPASEEVEQRYGLK